jgi:hypothetical protein
LREFQRNHTGRARSPRPLNLGDGNRFNLFSGADVGRIGLASNARRQPEKSRMIGR